MRWWLGLALLLVHPVVLAGACEDHSLPVNAGFESPSISASSPPAVETYTGVKLYLQTNVPGWRTPAPAGLIEIWQSVTSGVTAYEGTQFAEVQAASMHSLYQDVRSVPGSTIRWSFAHRGRSGTDTLEVRIGATTSTVSQQTVSTGVSSWRLVSGTYVVPAGQTTTRFELRPIASYPYGGSIGNLVDAVKLQVDCDYGDAAASYGVLAAADGPAHVVSSARLGTQLDQEADGAAGASANGDDGAGVDDEDGLLAGSSWNLGAASSLVVQASAAGYLSAWVDAGRDGAFQAADRILVDVPVTAGTNTLAFTLPATGAPGSTTLRLRYSTSNPAGALGPLGYWPDGEVEDHLVVLVRSVHMEWRFDEFEWTGASGEVVNSGAAGGPATAANGANTGQEAPALTGASGTCSFGRFDGVNDAVLIGSLADLDVAYPPERLTLAAWIRPRLVSSSEQLVVVRGEAGSGSNRLDLALYTRAGRYEFRQRRGNRLTIIGAPAPGGDLNSWVHLAAVYDGTAWRLYRNGSQIAVSASTSGPMANSSALWAIGARHPSNSGATSPFTGDIDEVNLWRRDLSALEIAQLPLQRHACPQANLTVVKSVQAEADLHGTVNAKSLPASTSVYTINVTNSGPGGTDAGTLVINDALPPDVEFWSGNFDGNGSPVQFVDGAPPSGLSMQFTGLADTADDVVFLDASGAPMVPNGAFDPAVRTLRVEFDERMRPAGRSFSLRFRVRLK